MKQIKELQIPLAFLIIFVMILSSFYVFFLSPKLKGLKSVKKQLQTTENDLQQAKMLVKSNDLPDQKEKKKWEAVQARIDMIPAGIKLHELTGNLARIARDCHIPEVSFSNTQNAPAFELDEPRLQLGDYVIKMSFDCQYRHLAYFLKKLDDMALGAVVELLEAKKKALPLIHAEFQIRPLGMTK